MDREQLMAWLLKHKAYTREQLQEYFEEAEHQEGVEYWDQFDNPHDLAKDVRTYFLAKG